MKLNDLKNELSKEQKSSLMMCYAYEREKELLSKRTMEEFPINFMDICNTVEYFDHRQILLKQVIEKLELVTEI